LSVILEAKNVCKQYGSGAAQVEALRRVDIQVEAGEFLAIMGQSGSGKSTLLHVLGGIDPPTSGQVLLDGQELGSLADTPRSLIRRRRLGFVFQKINLLPTLSAIANVALPLRIDGVSASVARDRAQAALELVGIAQRARHYPHEMSGGEQQRVAVARAMVIHPAVILADEPTGSLDSTNAQRILELLRDCVKQGQAIVMVTHDGELARRADRVVVMQDGRIIETVAYPDTSTLSTGAAGQEMRR
jgi:putative ABC transport system ATP-binding protein